MAQAALFAVAPLGQAHAMVNGHGCLTRCVLDGLAFNGAAQWGAASYYDEADGAWHVDLASLCDYAAARIGADIPATSWQREYQLPRVWASEKVPGALYKIYGLPRRPFVLRVDPPAAAASVKAWLSVNSIPVAEWPPCSTGQPVDLPPERYRLSAELIPGARGWLLPPLAERIVDLRARDEVCIRVVPVAPGDALGVDLVAGAQGAPPVMRQSLAPAVLRSTVLGSARERREDGLDKIFGHHYYYYASPLIDIPKDPPYMMWFASWDADQYGYRWSTQRPIYDTPTWGVWATTGSPPPNATVLGSGGKDLPPPPLAFPSSSLADFQKTFASWLDVRSVRLGLEAGDVPRRQPFGSPKPAHASLTVHAADQGASVRLTRPRAMPHHRPHQC